MRTHLDQSVHNIAFLKSIFETQYTDWMITVTFYAALHVMEHCLGEKGVRGNRTSENPHKDRSDLVETHFPEIKYNYKYLYRKSRSARYEFYDPAKMDVTILVNSHLKVILDWCDKEFKTNFKFT